MKKQPIVNHHDGFMVKPSRTGSYGFTEGRKAPLKLRSVLSLEDCRKIDQCARRRGIKGVGHHAQPDYLQRGMGSYVA